MKFRIFEAIRTETIINFNHRYGVDQQINSATIIEN